MLQGGLEGVITARHELNAREFVRDQTSSSNERQRILLMVEPPQPPDPRTGSVRQSECRPQEAGGSPVVPVPRQIEPGVYRTILIRSPDTPREIFGRGLAGHHQEAIRKACRTPLLNGILLCH